MNAKKMTLKKLEGKFRGCKSSDDQLSRMLQIAKDGAFLHRRYIHYTSLDCLKKIAKSGKVFLTKCTSKNLNDWNESNKFGAKDVQNRLYFMSFSHGTAESVPFWKMYCQPDETAVCFSVTGRDIKRWMASLQPSEEKQSSCVSIESPDNKTFKEVEKDLKIVDAGFTDILYAGVRDKDSPHHNAVSWNGVCRNVNTLDAQIKIAEASGLMKDYEWHFENETRLYVVLEKPIAQDRVAIELPKGFFKNAHVRLGPWLDKESFGRAKKEIRNACPDLTEDAIRESVLSGALEQWKTKK